MESIRPEQNLIDFIQFSKKLVKYKVGALVYCGSANESYLCRFSYVNIFVLHSLLRVE